ncbi:MAG: tRNA uridine-5-carboxymethylaminomethyl(34) synthesis GTPase MnmE [Bdellovibrionales bacterium]|nr:tRNA uridine-5-carboxymethylaminomethyl(34) synthesis GTPase MnmE [Bdellovibrionales bacterium]
MYLPGDTDTIAAISTPLGRGGIAVIRVSGAQSLKIVQQIAPFLPERIESHRVYFGVLRNSEYPQGLDEVLLTYFANGKSYTGEQTVELSCHGSDFVAKTILKLLMGAGARLAEKGEFTYRAFCNGKLDLVQAEAVLNLIESQSEQAAMVAFRQLKGGLSKSIEKIEDLVVWSAAHLEANIDFAQEDIEVASQADLLERLQQASEIIKSLLRTEAQGRWYKEGFRVVLLGLPNTGKSSLLNALLGEDKAIVNDQPGTTRDLVEGLTLVEGVEVSITDTAGLRETEDLVEKMGVERSFKQIPLVDFIFYVFDFDNQVRSLEELDKILVLKPKRTKIAVIFNKLDLYPGFMESDYLDNILALSKKNGFKHSNDFFIETDPDKFLFVSATTRWGLENFNYLIAKRIQEGLVDNSEVVISMRHFELLSLALKSIERAVDLLKSQASPEFVSFELKDAVLSIHTVLGKRFDDQVMDRVFKEFCLGK